MSAEEQPQEGYVGLISSDGHEFWITKEAACVSKVLKPMVQGDGHFRETLDNKIPLQDIPHDVAEKLCEYLYYSLKYKDQVSDIPEFEIPPEMALELLVAADYLDV
ncbi:BTB/POZ protein [Yarrowia lipolytica]|jgi:transcription elongation factor B subunit 1|uniref:Elongin-C n=2 Tax=Yarrowia lipolytica TaxID=4952 RepID=Q6CHY2_YARLI|nr:YALI0A03575p [Yarrowia lipolytica CLIB122]AOW00218.1 hypothetical protein YALI1_A03809g [Yarrowia lipolytica]KAB8284216.1 BTB/POZ protein [Yarrowia lipolytica]KAE8173129.1 BTB/POZ protein [Yarrowia lipolytica]KAJ8051338.1 BTB/POZ protein [Yarrowia lipolytica]QNP95066.1 Elongin-C [Yarrowia lipolytica]|eukprot:XP_499729.1 YALI0A03575p [Yarrowia lipolytica CLIB122]